MQPLTGLAIILAFIQRLFSWACASLAGAEQVIFGAWPGRDFHRQSHGRPEQGERADLVLE